MTANDQHGALAEAEKSPVSAGFSNTTLNSHRKTLEKRFRRNCLILQVPPDIVENVEELSGVCDGLPEMRLNDFGGKVSFGPLQGLLGRYGQDAIAARPSVAIDAATPAGHWPTTAGHKIRSRPRGAVELFVPPPKVGRETTRRGAADQSGGVGVVALAVDDFLHDSNPLNCCDGLPLARGCDQNVWPRGDPVYFAAGVLPWRCDIQVVEGERGNPPVVIFWRADGFDPTVAVAAGLNDDLKPIFLQAAALESPQQPIPSLLFCRENAYVSALVDFAIFAVVSGVIHHPLLWLSTYRVRNMVMHLTGAHVNRGEPVFFQTQKHKRNQHHGVNDAAPSPPEIYRHAAS
jgi:hypothetical protein